MGEDDAGGTVGDRNEEHAAPLHRLAAMLVAGTDAATALTADALAARPGADRATLRTEVVRAYLRAAPRRVDRTETGTPDGHRDPGDVLRSLPPRARAAAALSLVEGASDTEVAETVGVRRGKVGALVPTTPGLDVALTAVADRYALSGTALREALAGAAVSTNPRPVASPRRRRRQGLAAATAVALALATGYALTSGDVLGTGDAEDEAGVDDAGVADPDGPDLTEAGWELTDEGEPPQGVMGLTLRETVEVDAGGTEDLTLDSEDGAGATFVVLWCDMPPAEDANLDTPRGDVSVEGGSTVQVPCAGRGGDPAVSEVVPLPPSGEAQIRLDGDLPPDGSATLALYEEDRSGALSPLPGGGATDPPPVSSGSTVIDGDSTSTLAFPGETRLVERLEIGAESSLQVWVGGRGIVSVQVDGIPATDDGDLERYTSPSGEVAWSEQRPDLRDGTWWVFVPDSVLTVEVPESVRPAAGERRQVVVEVVGSGFEERTQVQVSDATRQEVDTAAVAATELPGEPAPGLILGHRLLGQWQVPLDGHTRELTGVEDLDSGTPIAGMALADATPERTGFFATGLLDWGDGVRTVSLYEDTEEAFRQLTQGFGAYRGFGQATPSRGEPPMVSLPPARGQPSATLLVYAEVPYGEFDFAAAEMPPNSWPAGEEPPSTLSPAPPEDSAPVVSIDQDDLEDGRVSVPLEGTSPTVARVTTTGRGRILFLIDGTPAHGQTPDGWWSSWTDQAVTTDVQLYDMASSRSSRELTVVVEDYEDFTVEVLGR